MSPAREDPPDSRRYARLWAGVIAVLVAVTVATQWGSEDPAASGDDGYTSMAEPAPTATPESAAPELPSDVDPSVAAAPVRCWSGAEAVDLGGCPPLTREEGLRYVFPLADDPLCAEVALTDALKVVALRCPVDIDGETATVTYSEFAEREAMLDYYDDKFPEGPSGRSEDLVLYGPARLGDRPVWQGSAIYGPGGRWSVSFRGRDEDRTRRVLETVEVRRWAALRGSVDPADLDSNDP